MKTSAPARCCAALRAFVHRACARLNSSRSGGSRGGRHQSMVRTTKMRAKPPVIVAAVLMLAGCSTMKGGQDSALASSTIQVAKPEYTRDNIILSYEQADDKRAYRAKIAGLFMEAIDENYANYTKDLFNEGIQVGLGFDTAIIGLSTSAALFEESAGDLASVIAGFAGVRGAIDKNLYFDRTLPALIATMDARRSQVEATILSGLTQTPDQYPIHMLLRDLRRLQDAGTLFRAIVDVTSEASEAKGEAEDEVQRQYELARAFSCVPEDDQSVQLQPIVDSLRSAYRNATDKTQSDVVRSQGDLQVRRIAAVAGTNPVGSIEDVRNRILDRLDQEICTAAEVTELNSRFQALGGGKP